MVKKKNKKTLEQKNEEFCRYGVAYSSRLLEAFGKEIEGVKKAGDIEYIHRMRVASRRLRASLPLFSACFPRKRYRTWIKEIGRITRALGRARDLDVQIEFLESYLAGIRNREYERTGTGTVQGAGDSWRGVEILLLRLKQERKRVQPVVIGDLRRLERKEVIREMEDAFGQFTGNSTEANQGQEICSDRLFSTAGKEISERLAGLLRYEKSVFIPSAIEDHHAMRIEAKKLRYTMETFASLYGRDLKEPLKAIKGLQELLGELHDCDVWTEYLPRFLEQERESTIEYFGKDDFFALIEPGIRTLLDDLHQRRISLYSDLVATWKDLNAKGVFQGLTRTITAPSGTPGMDPPANVVADDRSGGAAQERSVENQG